MKNLLLIGAFLLCLSSYGQIIKPDYTAFGMDTEHHIPKGLSKGDIAPNFTLRNQYGKTVDLQTLLKKGPVALIFYRGQWCSYCSKHLIELEDGLEAMFEKNIQIVAVTPVSKEQIKTTVEEYKLRYHVVSDADLSLMKAYDVAFQVTDAYNEKLEKYMKTSVEKSNASGEAVLPVPATFVISQNGKIKKAFFDPDYSKRSSVKDILKSVK